MGNLEHVFFGLVAITIGVIFLLRCKTFVKMATESQKAVNSVLGKKREYKGIGYKIIPKIIVVLIGLGFSLIGIVSILSSF